MNRLKKAAALLLAGLMTTGLAACSAGESTKWVAKAGDLTVPAGVYIEKLMGEYYTVTDKLTADGSEMPKNPLKEQVDGVQVSDAIVAAAKKDLDKFIAAEMKFAELGLTLSDNEKAIAEQNVEQFWQFVSEAYTANGISKESYLQSSLNNSKQDAIFRSIYDKGGSEEVPESELKDKFSNDYAKILVISLKLSSSEDADAKAKADQSTRDYIDEAYQKAKDGADMEDLVFEARKKASSDPDSLTKPEKGSSYTIIGKDNSPYDQTVTDAVFAAKLGEPTKVETDTTAYMFVRYDINENPDDFTARRLSLLYTLRDEDFKAKLDDWAANLTGVTYNDAALKRYTPDKLKMA